MTVTVTADPHAMTFYSAVQDKIIGSDSAEGTSADWPGCGAS